MRIPGYCTSCRRVRTVNASGRALAIAGATRSPVEGICAACEAFERAERTFRPGVRVYDRQRRAHGRVVTAYPVERGAHDALVWVAHEPDGQATRVPADVLELARGARPS